MPHQIGNMSVIAHVDRARAGVLADQLVPALREHAAQALQVGVTGVEGGAVQEQDTAAAAEELEVVAGQGCLARALGCSALRGLQDL